MAEERYMFFNSSGADRRVYDAADFAAYFTELYTSGIFKKPDAATPLKVTAGTGLSVAVAAGTANIKGYMYALEGADMTLPVDVSLGADRHDRVVLRLSLAAGERYIKLFVVKGTASAPPTLTRDDTIWELSLAQVIVRAGATSIAVGDVVDERRDGALCGLVSLMSKIDLELVAGDVLPTKADKIGNTPFAAGYWEMLGISLMGNDSRYNMYADNTENLWWHYTGSGSQLYICKADLSSKSLTNNSMSIAGITKSSGIYYSGYYYVAIIASGAYKMYRWNGVSGSIATLAVPSAFGSDLFVLGGQICTISGSSNKYIHQYNPSTNTWTSSTITTTATNDFQSSTIAVNPQVNEGKIVFVSYSTYVYTYTISNNSFEELPSNNPIFKARALLGNGNFPILCADGPLTNTVWGCFTGYFRNVWRDTNNTSLAMYLNPIMIADTQTNHVYSLSFSVPMTSVGDIGTNQSNYDKVTQRQFNFLDGYIYTNFGGKLARMKLIEEGSV